MRAALLLAGILALPTPAPAGERLSFGEGRRLATKEGQVLLVLVHGSDWHAFGERLLRGVWLDEDLARATGAHVVLADVDVLQAPTEEERLANDSRNGGWVKKGSGLRTYPAILAYAPDGSIVGTRQGQELPKRLDAARETLLAFVASCRTWSDLSADIRAAHGRGDTEREIALLIARDELPLDRVAGLLEDLKGLDPEDAAGHCTRLSLPAWNTLVKQATDEAKAGKGAEAEQRLRTMLDHAAYTDEQRAVIHLALGSAYRRWEGHASEAAAEFQAAWSAAPDSVCGIAGRRLYLKEHGGPSLAFGWGDRHTQSGAATWTLADFPGTLDPGTHRLRLRRGKGKDLKVTGVQLVVAGDPHIIVSQSVTLTKAAPLGDFELTTSATLTDVTLLIQFEPGAPSSGTIEWALMP